MVVAVVVPGLVKVVEVSDFARVLVVVAVELVV